MNAAPLFEVSKLLRHASIQMTERYAHLAPDYLHDVVASIKFSAHDKFGAERFTVLVGCWE
jgi:site-specific recombinase XerD